MNKAITIFLLLTTFLLSAYGGYEISSSPEMAITVIAGTLIVCAILCFMHGKKWAASLAKLEKPALIFALITACLVSLSYGAFTFFGNIPEIYYMLASVSGLFFSSLLLLLESGLFRN